jgi:hypothetical protein
MGNIMNFGCPKSGIGPALSLLMVVLAACSASRSPTTQTGTESTSPPRAAEPTEPTEQHPQLQDPGSPPNEPGTVPSKVESDRACSRDDECILSTFPGCCSCCQCSPPHALRADAEQRLHDSCSQIKCEAKSCLTATCVPCGSLAATVRAVCAEGLCSVAH